ncbi:MAG: hypothetical protein AB1351_13625 [Thermoproteota archaeon]
MASYSTGNAMAGNIFSAYWTGIYMNYKKEIEEPMKVEHVKDLELDEMPRPTRKVSNTSVPVPDNAESSTHDRIKGRHVIK